MLSDVIVRDLQNQPHPTQWHAKVDTGADRSAIPVQICHDLGLVPRCFEPVSGFSRSAPPPQVPVYYLTVEVPGFSPITLRVYGVQRQSILLGRDFLENMVFLMNARGSRFALARWTPLRGAFSWLLSWA